MAVKKFIIKQKTNWNTRGEKVGTHTVTMDEADVAGYIALLDGDIEVYEQSLTLSVAAATASTSIDLIDFISIKHSALKPIYVSNSNKRPIVLNSKISLLEEYLENLTPFPAPYASDKPTDVQTRTGNMDLM